MNIKYLEKLNAKVSEYDNSSKLELSSGSWSFSLMVKLIFFKTPYFKNNPSDTNIIYRSFLISMFTVPALFLLIVPAISEFSPIDFSDKTFEITPVEVAVALLSIFSVSYWNLRNQYADKWKYCADLYNKIVFVYSDKLLAEEILFKRTTFALDLLQMDLYGHPSFSKMFNHSLITSILYCQRFPNYIDEINLIDCALKNCKCEKSTDKEIKRFFQGCGTKKQAYKYLSKLQNDLDKTLVIQDFNNENFDFL